MNEPANEQLKLKKRKLTPKQRKLNNFATGERAGGPSKKFLQAQGFEASIRMSESKQWSWPDCIWSQAWRTGVYRGQVTDPQRSLRSIHRRRSNEAAIDAICGSLLPTTNWLPRRLSVWYNYRRWQSGAPLREHHLESAIAPVSRRPHRSWLATLSGGHPKVRPGFTG